MGSLFGKAWPGLVTNLMLVVLALPGAISLSNSDKPLEVLVIGDSIPDPSLFVYDPSLQYRVVPYPSWAGSWTGEETSRWSNMQKAARTLVPADFIIELPYGAYNSQAINAELRNACHASISARGASVLLPVPATPILAHFAPDETHMDPDQDGYSDRLAEQNKDLLGGRLNKQFTIEVGADPLMDFSGLIDEYHDANLFLMDRPHELAKIVATIQSQGTPPEDPKGEDPWLLALNLSNTPSGARLRARGYVWKCASPLNGIFFFPQGGLVSTHMVPGTGYVRVDNLKTDEEHPYAWDILSHIILHSQGRDIPDLIIAHEAREKFASYYSAYSDAYRALEMADALSASSQTYSIWLDLAQLGKGKVDAAKAYRSGQVESASQAMEEILRGIEGSRKRAEANLRTSLFMIHLSQYIVVTATLLFSISITLHFVSAPRTRPVATTRYVAGGVTTESVEGPFIRYRRTPWHRGLIVIIVVVLVAAPGVALFWNRLSRIISWQTVHMDQAWYREIDEDPSTFDGRLAYRDWSKGRIEVNPSKGTARFLEEGSPPAPGSIITRAEWPYELRREGLPTIPIAASQGDQGFLVLKRFTGYLVEVKGKLRKPRITHEGSEYVVTGVLELVPGAIREAQGNGGEG